VRLTALALALFLTAPALGACGSDDSRSSGAVESPATRPEKPRPSVDIDALPTSYRFVLHATCGERQLSGDYHLVVRDGDVVAARPARSVRLASLHLHDFPTLAGLVEKATNAEPDAVVDLRVDDAGIPTSLSIDHLPDAIDDEECYRVTGLRVHD
jgi:hypothetical protein